MDSYILEDFNGLDNISDDIISFLKFKESNEIGTFIENKDALNLEFPELFYGWYSVYVGVIDDSDSFTINTGTKSNLVDLKEEEFEHSLNNNKLREVFVTNYNFEIENIEINIPKDSKSKIAYIRLLRMNENYIKLWNKPDERDFIVFYDNDAYSDFFQEENKTLDMFLENSVYQYERLNTSVINYCIGTTGLLFYNSDYTVKPYTDFSKYESLVREGDLAAKRDILNLIENIGAPLEIICINSKESQVYASIRVNTGFLDDYRGFLNGELNNRFEKYKQRDNSQRLSYYYPEYRQYILNVVSELFSKFNIDGITLDFTRYPVLFGSELKDKNERIFILNEFMREIKKIVPKDKKINVRFPYDLEKYELDIKTWVNEELVDSISPSVLSYEDFYDIKPFIDMIKNKEVELYIGITANVSGEDLNVKTEKLYEQKGAKALNNKYLSISDYLKRAYDCYKEGVDGVFLFNITCQIGEDYKHPSKLVILSSKTALEKWHAFEYPSIVKIKKIEIQNKCHIQFNRFKGAQQR